MKQLATLVLLFLVPAFLHAEDRFANVTITTEAVAGNVHVLFGAGGNIGVSHGGDGILIVDDQYAPLADKISAALAEFGTGNATWVLNTHFHGDHTGSNAFFGTDSLIMSHDNVRSRLINDDTDGELAPEALPVVTYSETASIYFNGEEIRLIHMPSAHTDGDSIIWFKTSDVVHMGDLFFKDRFPFVDLASGGSVQGYIAGVEQALELVSDNTRIIPGHGTLANKADLARFLSMLKTTTQQVRQAKAAGKSADEAVTIGLGEAFKSWGSGFINEDRWIRTIFASGE